MAIMWINKQTKTKTSKTINPKKQNIWDNVWCRLMFLFSLGFFCFVLVSKWKFEKNVFVEWIWSIKISKETQGLFLVLETFQCRKPNLKCWKKQKTTWILFVFWYILIDHIHSKKQVFFGWIISIPKNKERKNNLLSQNQTFPQTFFLVLLEFLF